MLEFNRIPQTSMERRKIADRLKLLDAVHKAGMKFGYLLTNTVVSTVPDNEEPAGQLGNRAKTLCPRVPGNFEKTMANAKFYMDTYKEADFFEEFAADWGGCHCGECGVPQFMQYVKALGEHAAHINRRATLYADTWCISFWGPDPTKIGWRHMFDKEITASREVMAALPSMPSNVGIGLPCHHHYRPLTFLQYGGRNATPLFPTRADAASITAGGRRTLAWPHFVMDDDAYRPKSWGIVHSEVRYIRALLQSLRTVGMQSVMGNLYLPTLQLINTFAFGQLSANPALAPETVLQRFARLIVQRQDTSALTDILAWLENNSWWQVQMPEDGRIPNLSCSLRRQDAERIAGGLRPNPKPDYPLPISPQRWLDELRRSVNRMEWAA